MENSVSEELVSKTLERFVGLKEQLISVKFNSVKSVVSAGIELVKFVESLSRDGEIQKSDKKELVIKVLNRLIDIPKVPEFAEAWVIGFAVDLIVCTLNKSLGQDWLNKLSVK